jgi:hypothetical protein
MATAAPTITSVAPNFGLAAGGTHVTITGAGFTNAGAAWSPAVTVVFGAQPATAVVVVSDTEITCTAPALDQDGTVKVTTPNGTATLTAGFSWRPPGLMCGQWPWRDGDTYPSISGQRTSGLYESWVRRSPPATE